MAVFGGTVKKKRSRKWLGKKERKIIRTMKFLITLTTEQHLATPSLLYSNNIQLDKMPMYHDQVHDSCWNPTTEVMPSKTHHLRSLKCYFLLLEEACWELTLCLLKGIQVVPLPLELGLDDTVFHGLCFPPGKTKTMLKYPVNTPVSKLCLEKDQ